ncbi:HTH-type transcriptional regulator BetI [bioreactor metagenome]|uniref:HTH-type transcriptional regulator BetI n=1 Tax=bioreactor metagenome TaxID=1076179 RepID=A0A645ENY5_9ZZZZ
MPARAKAATPRNAYHHGHLREALIEAAVGIIEEQGVEQLSVREAAKRAGVSPGAPFRHFANRTALLTAVAEQAAERLRQAVQQALANASGQPPLARFAAIGHAYLAWAAAHPTHFRVISDRQLIDYDNSASMQAGNEAIREQMASLLQQALGLDADAERIAQTLLAARALVYGLARMAADGHFPEWNTQSGSDRQAITDTLDHFIAQIARP